MATGAFSTELDLGALDLTDRALYRHGFPHEVFRQLRQQAPLWWHPEVPGCEEIGGGGFWVLSRYHDVQAASRAPERFAAVDGPGLPQDRGGNSPMLTSMDGERHLRQRKLISAGFTPRMTRRLEDLARTWAAKIVDEALERETCNFVHDVAYQLPMHMIADIVGVPVEDRPHVFQLCNDVIMCSDPDYHVPRSDRDRVMGELFVYGKDLAARKRRQPEDDVWSLLTQVEGSEPGDAHGQLSELELDGFFVLLNVAGSETTRNAISQGLLALLEDPAQLERLKTDPSVRKRATEEIIRWTSPVSYFRRTVVEDTELGGVAMKAGERISMWYPSANRDEAVFENPYHFDIDRQARDQVAFGGGGPHFCLGAHLARREITILFEELFSRVRDIEIVGERTYSVQGISNPIVVSLKGLPVRLAA